MWGNLETLNFMLVNVSVNGYVCLSSPAMSWRLVQGVTLPSSYETWDSRPHDPVCSYKWEWNMGAWKESLFFLCSFP